jgi:hypothetical protein
LRLQLVVHGASILSRALAPTIDLCGSAALAASQRIAPHVAARSLHA